MRCAWTTTRPFAARAAVSRNQVLRVPPLSSRADAPRPMFGFARSVCVKRVHPVAICSVARLGMARHATATGSSNECHRDTWQSSPRRPWRLPSRVRCPGAYRPWRVRQNRCMSFAEMATTRVGFAARSGLRHALTSIGSANKVRSHIS